MKKTFFLLALILILGATLRFYKLGDVPVGFHRDEAFLGYNAYSILQTGKDMSGKFLPLHLESFLYSPAGYSYFSIPFIKFFGLSAFSVRFASAFFGSLTILVTYFLTKELFYKLLLANSYSLIAAILLAISPWHINLSRTATENTVVVFFVTLGVLFFLFWIKKGNWYLLASSFISFEITFLIYQAPRAFLPLLVLLLTILFLKSNKKKIFLVSILFFIMTIIPLFIILLSPQLSLRIRTVSLFATSETQLVIDEQLREDGGARVFHNKLIGYSGQFIQNYFKHFSFDFLFGDQGLPIRYKVPSTGLLYLFELPLLLLGIWILLKKHKREGMFLIGWMILAPVGSALTFDDVPNLQRTILVFPALAIIIAAGLYGILNFIENKKFFYPVLSLIIFVIFYNFVFYLHQYYVHQLVHRPWYRHEGYRELVQKVNALLPNYKKATVTDRESAPTIFFLFYGRYDPAIFQKETQNSTFRDFDRINFGKYEFSQEECPLREEIDKKTNEKYITGEKNVLYVNYGVCKVPKKTAELIGTIKREDQTAVFQMLETKE